MRNDNHDSVVGAGDVVSDFRLREREQHESVAEPIAWEFVDAPVDDTNER